MTTQSAPQFPDDLYTVRLVDGLPVERDGKTIYYKQAKLRDVTVADERAAVRLSERVVFIEGAPKLLSSDADFRFAMTLQHIDQLVCDSLVLQRAVLDMDLLGKLSPHDLGLIESRVFLIALAAEVRYGNLTMEAFDKAWRGESPQAALAPQPVGQAAGAGADAAVAESGPQMLADFVRPDAAGADHSAAS